MSVTAVVCRRQGADRDRLAKAGTHERYDEKP